MKASERLTALKGSRALFRSDILTSERPLALCGLVAQWIERIRPKDKVGGSSPFEAANFAFPFCGTLQRFDHCAAPCGIVRTPLSCRRTVIGFPKAACG